MYVWFLLDQAVHPFQGQFSGLCLKLD